MRAKKWEGRRQRHQGVSLLLTHSSTSSGAGNGQTLQMCWKSQAADIVWRVNHRRRHKLPAWFGLLLVGDLGSCSSCLLVFGGEATGSSSGSQQSKTQVVYIRSAAAQVVCSSSRSHRQHSALQWFLSRAAVVCKLCMICSSSHRQQSGSQAAERKIHIFPAGPAPLVRELLQSSAPPNFSH